MGWPALWFDAAVASVIVAIILPECRASNSKVLIGTCHTLKLYAATTGAREQHSRGLRAANQAKDNKEGLRDTYALFRDELSAISEKIPEEIYWLS